MPYVASTGTYVPSRSALCAVPTWPATAYARALETDYHVSRDSRSGVQIRLVHNVFRSTAVSASSAMTKGEGATYGAG
jgi:hypothetical protein